MSNKTTPQNKVNSVSEQSTNILGEIAMIVEKSNPYTDIQAQEKVSSLVKRFKRMNDHQTTWRMVSAMMDQLGVTPYYAKPRGVEVADSEVGFFFLSDGKSLVSSSESGENLNVIGIGSDDNGLLITKYPRRCLRGA